MADKPDTRRNRPALALHVPEPPFRPGDTPDFSSIKVPPAGEAPRPDVAGKAQETFPVCTSLVRVLDLDTGKRRVITLVLPSDADAAQHRISVLAPIGAALLGLRAGDDVEWGTPGDVRRLHIEHVVQPDQLVATQRIRPIPRERYGPHGAH